MKSPTEKRYDELLNRFLLLPIGDPDTTRVRQELDEARAEWKAEQAETLK